MPEESSKDTLERRRAQAAYNYVRDLERGSDLKRLAARVQGFPIEMRSQGLTVAVATLLKEDRKESRDLAAQLSQWLFQKSGVVETQQGTPTAGMLLDYCVKCTRAEYLVVQVEALAYLEHVKRLASALEKTS